MSTNIKLQTELDSAYDLYERNRTTYQVNEIFHSIQGEGVLVGAPATFIRLQGCSVGCSWCDTKYTWATRKGKNRVMLGTSMSPTEIAEQVQHNHVVITGGEPTMWNLDRLIRELRHHRPKCYIQLETSAQFWFKGIERPDWVTWSPKANLAFAEEVDHRWHVACSEIKFVVDEKFLFATALYLEIKAHKLGNRPYIVLMPEGSPPTKENTDKVLRFFSDQKGMLDVRKWRLGQRLQYTIGVD